MTEFWYAVVVGVLTICLVSLLAYVVTDAVDASLESGVFRGACVQRGGMVVHDECGKRLCIRKDAVMP